MGQKKVSKRKHINSEIEGSKSETGKAVTNVPDDAEVMSTVATCVYACSLFIVLYIIQN